MDVGAAISKSKIATRSIFGWSKNDVNALGSGDNDPWLSSICAEWRVINPLMKRDSVRQFQHHWVNMICDLIPSRLIGRLTSFERLTYGTTDTCLEKIETNQ